MSRADYDLLIIGGGSGGITAGRIAGMLGFRVAIIEAKRLGGECTWTGCVPSKGLIAAANAYHSARHTERFGLPHFEATGAVDLGSVLKRVHELQHHIYDADDSPEALARSGCKVIEGRARFVSERTVEVAGQRLSARRFLLATGGDPLVPPIDRLAEARPLTIENLFELSALPQRLAVLGGGPTGVEMGQAFQRLGSQVTIFERSQLLDAHDPELVAVVEEQLRAEGTDIRLSAEVTCVVRQGASVEVTSEDGVNEFDEILVATGNRPRTEGLGLDRAGVELTEPGFVQVGPTMQTSNPAIYACGDVIGPPRSTNAAGSEAAIAVRNALFPWRSDLDHQRTITAVFTDPELGRLGMTEDEARERHRSVRVYRYPFASNDRARIEGQTAGMVKLVCAGVRDRVVGAHVVGMHAGDLMNEIAVGLAGGASTSDLASIAHGYPTAGEAIREAAQGSLERWLRNPAARGALRGYIWASRRLEH